jgi:hypothetical protein
MEVEAMAVIMVVEDIATEEVTEKDMREVDLTLIEIAMKERKEIISIMMILKDISSNTRTLSDS